MNAEGQGLADTRTLACIGLDGFAKARLRLLLSEAAPRLDATWALGKPGRADLLLLAENSAEADAAAITAGGRGVQCVYVRASTDQDASALPVGFDVEDLVRVLSTATSSMSEFHSLDATAPEFFDVAATEVSFDELSFNVDMMLDDTPARMPMEDAEEVPEAVDLERFLRRDSGEYTLDKMVPFGLQEDTVVERSQQGQSSSRAEFRNTQRNPYMQRPGESAASSPMVMEAPAAPPQEVRRGGRPLSDYLEGELLMAPSQVVLEHAEPLILDPKNQVYMIVGDLASADPYAQMPLLESDIQRLTTRELERWRALCDVRPYLRLKWLVALRRGDGWLPRHLDPGGSYRIRRMLDLDAFFDDQIRISEVLQDWHRLHEVTAKAGVDMQSVFNTVAAYDAIGWLETQPRERFRK